MRRTDLICIATSTTFTSITRSSNYFTLFKDGFFLALVTTSWPIRQIVEYFSPLFLKSRLVKGGTLWLCQVVIQTQHILRILDSFILLLLFFATQQNSQGRNWISLELERWDWHQLLPKWPAKTKRQKKKVGGGLMTPSTPPTCPVAVALCYAARSVRGWKLTQPKRHLKAIQIHSGMKAAKNQEAAAQSYSFL